MSRPGGLWPRVARIAFAAVFAASLVVIAVGGRGVALGLDSRSWLPAAGNVVEKHADEHEFTTTDGHSEVGTGSSPTYVLTYDFEVGGATHRSSEFEVGGGAPTRDEWDETGPAVTVFYDPSDPSRCALRSGVASSRVLLLATGIVLAGGTAATFLLTRERTR